MIRILLWLWISIAIRSSHGASFSLHCTFGVNGFAEIGGVYWCRVNGLNVSSPSDIITGIVGNHLNNELGIIYQNDDVKGLDIHTQTCPYIPKNIHLHFKNLVALQIHNSGLLQITQNDLKPFKQLRTLRLRQDPIEVLEKDLFIYNTQLEYLYISYNKIKHIDADLLAPMPILKTFDLRENICINAVVSGANIATLTPLFENQCQDEIIC